MENHLLPVAFSFKTRQTMYVYKLCQVLIGVNDVDGMNDRIMQAHKEGSPDDFPHK